MRFAPDEKAPTTFEMLARCFEALGGVPKVVLADRMGCLKGARRWPTSSSRCQRTCALPVRMVYRPDFCQGHDPESKGIVENLVGYAKLDLVVPQELTVADLEAANEAAKVLVRRSERPGPLRD